MFLLCVYKLLVVINNIFINEMYVFLDLVIVNRLNVMCLGDLNCDLLYFLDVGKEGRIWLDICDIYDMVNFIIELIRICKIKELCLDIIVMNVFVFEL